MTGAPQPCRFDGDDAPGAPRVWALAVDHGAPGASPEATRQRARDQVRATLRALLAQHFQLPLSAIAVDDRRGARVRAALVAGTPVPPGWATLGLSISHEAGVALIALRTAVLQGLGIAHLPAVVVRDDLAAGRLIELVPGWAPKCGIVHAIFPSRRGLLPSVRTLIDFLGEEFSHSDIA